MSRIINTRVYGLDESIIASGYPKLAELPSLEHASRLAHAHMARARILAKAKGGSGHDCFLKGIIVQADFIMSHGWWMQAQRYHWFDIVSSQSKEHSCEKLYGHSDIDSVTMAELLGARVTTNYLQLKTMYAQRRMHRRQEWREFCDWVKCLPHSDLITGAKEEE